MTSKFFDNDDAGIHTDIRTGVARSLVGRELAREVARQELAAFKAEREATRLADAVRLGRAVELPIAEMERMAGVSRQTVYNAIHAAAGRRPRQADQSLLRREVLTALVAAEGAVPIAELAARLDRDPDDLRLAISGLAHAGLCRVLSAGYDDQETWQAVAVAAEPGAEDQLRARFDELFVGRAAAFGVYLAVDRDEAPAIAAAAQSVMSAHEHTLMSAEVAPSVMRGPELGFAVYAPTSRSAITIANDLWRAIRDEAGLEPLPTQLTAVISPTPSPNAESAALDAFAAAITERVRTEDVAAILRQREAYPGGESEQRLAARCLTAAAMALRQAVGQDRSPRMITDSDAAFGELESVRPLVVDGSREKIQEPLIAALQLATERLGPFAGGRLGSFRHPEGETQVAEAIEPSQQDLVEMSALAGQAIAAASEAMKDFDAATAVRDVVRG